MKELTSLAPSFKLERKKRLLKRKDFLYIQKRGQRIHGKLCVLVVLGYFQNQTGKLGITVPKKIGKAHQRNLIKRRIRHIVRLEQAQFLKQNVVVIAKEPSIDASFKELSLDLLKCLNKHLSEKRRIS